MSGTSPPFRFDDAELRSGRDVAQIGAEGELEAAAEGNAMHGGDHRHGLSPTQHQRAHLPPMVFQECLQGSGYLALSGAAIP